GFTPGDGNGDRRDLVHRGFPYPLSCGLVDDEVGNQQPVDELSDDVELFLAETWVNTLGCLGAGRIELFGRDAVRQGQTELGQGLLLDVVPLVRSEVRDLPQGLRGNCRIA